MSTHRIFTTAFTRQVARNIWPVHRSTHWGAGMKLLESRYIGSIASCERPRRGCVLFFGALNLFAVGIVGEYIAKIMEEVKARPRLIRAALIKALAKPKLGFRLF